MRCLLDTHVWLWMRTAPERFASSVREILEDPESQLYLSAVSSWEVSIKFALGKLSLPEHPRHYVPKTLRAGLLPLSISHAHTVEVANLPPHHLDPFDRLLVAQSRIEEIPLVTADRALEPYDIELVWATD